MQANMFKIGKNTSTNAKSYYNKIAVMSNYLCPREGHQVDHRRCRNHRCNLHSSRLVNVTLERKKEEPGKEARNLLKFVWYINGMCKFSVNM